MTNHEGHTSNLPGAEAFNLAITERMTTPGEDAIAALQVKLKDEIRRQVEYYFSDENLQRDNCLLAQISGSKNMPVPVQTIRDFPSMKKYHSLQILLDALKESDTVNAIELNGVWYLHRHSPFPMELHEVLEHQKTLKKAQKQARKPRTAKVRLASPLSSPCLANTISPQAKPTGFEDFYADAPLTPAAHAAERALYDSDAASLPMRLETAIQQFARRRTFTPAHRRVWLRWMAFGGVDSGPRQFTGVDNATLRDMTRREAAEVLATDFLTADARDPGKMELDFAGVARAFLSCVVPGVWDVARPVELKRCVGVLRNFYNYLLHHDCVPECRERVLAAREACDAAEKEFPIVEAAMRVLPGGFNVACSMLFGGLHSVPVPDMSWMTGPEDGAGSETDKKHMTIAEARGIYSVAQATFGLEHPPVADFTQEPEFQRKAMSLEIVDFEPSILELPTLGNQCRYNLDIEHHAWIGKPLGKLICRPWAPPDFVTWDLPPHIRGTVKDPSVMAKTEAEHMQLCFLLEVDVYQQCCFRGMKLEIDVYQFSDKWHFFDNMRLARPSFYTVMLNELQEKWRVPRVITREEHEKRDTWVANRATADEATEGDGVDADLE
ncbi:hypothetical protein FH972_022434 [Carpinus fangiana]|uniref:HTH La-type RNA-binding domain-containing protein n=1 Tax=Carpinus fangiana TaxID=176857 RepID=A0A5N6KSX0_9ROSI|nr:hypothetical protein FH972_022434 [Carpinus fangiana]